MTTFSSSAYVLMCSTFSHCGKFIVCYSFAFALFFLRVRDVLPVRLTVPRWICSVSAKTKVELSQLKPGELFVICLLFISNAEAYLANELFNSFFFSDPEAWLDTPPGQQTDEMTHRELSNMMCSIQVATPSINV